MGNPMHQYPKFIAAPLYGAMHANLNREQQLAGMLQNLKHVFEITTRQYDDQSQLIRAVIEAGTQIFKLETGIVSRIENNEYTVLDVVTPLAGLATGDVFPVEGTYCREVVKSGQVLGFPYVGNLSYMVDHPVYQNMQLEAYLSAPIWVDGEIVGTLNFTSKHHREEGFSTHEKDMITMMANALATFMLVRNREEQLASANNQLKKFVGYVAHDLRNPLGGIQSLATQALKPNTPDGRRDEALSRIQNLSSVTLDFVHSILEISALGTGRIEPKIQSVQLLPALQVIEANLEELCALKHSHVLLSCDAHIHVLADPTLLNQAISNLLANALKYSPEQEGITVAVSCKDALCYISIQNPKEQVHPKMDDISRYRSYGFGLDIASEIIKAHGSQLTLNDAPESFTATFTLPLADQRQP